MADHIPTDTLPRDDWSTAMRQLIDNPGAVRSQSRVDIVDDYGRSTTWIIDTFRTAAGQVAFVQRMSADNPLRLVLPRQVMSALTRQQGTLTTRNRRKGARQAAATRKAKGIEPFKKKERA